MRQGGGAGCSFHKMSDSSPQTEALAPAVAGPRVIGLSMGQANRLIVNTLSNYALTFVSMIAALVMTPIVVRHLGQAGYGVAAIVLAPFGVFETLAGSFGRAMHRFIPVSLAEPDHRSLHRVFSTGVCGYVLIGLMGALLVQLFSGVLLGGDDIRPDLIKDGTLAIHVLAVWLVIGFPLWAYRKGLESIQRFDLMNLAHGIITVLRMVVVIVVFVLGYGSVTFFVASQLLGLLLCNWICRRQLHRCVPDLVFSPRLVDRKTLWMMGSFALATVLGTLGEILGGHGYRIFVGKAIGLHELGEFAAIMTLQMTIFRLVDELTSAFAPAVSALDAQGKGVNVAKLLVSGTKVSTLVAVSMAVVPLAASKPFLNLWLGPAFARRDTLFCVVLIALVPFCLGNPAMHILYGLGKASVCGPIQFLRSFVGLAVAFIYVTYFQQGLTGACVIMFAAQGIGGIVLMLHGCSVTGLPWAQALRKTLFRPVLIALVGAAVTYFVLHAVGDDSWWKLGISVASGEAVFIVLVLIAGVGVEEWHRIFSFLSAARNGIQRLLNPRDTKNSEDAPSGVE